MIACAGNLDTDNAITYEMSTALQSRLIHYELKVNLKDWVNWAAGASQDHRVISFLEARPDLLHNFNMNSSDKTFPCPRTWEFVSDLLVHNEDVTPVQLEPSIIGTVGRGAAMEFVAYTEIFGKLPNISDIIAKPAHVPVPDENDAKFALTGMISANMDKTNAKSLLAYVTRMPIEFQVITMRKALAGNVELFRHPAVGDWRRENSSVYM